MKNKINFWTKSSLVIIVAFVSLLIVLAQPTIILRGNKKLALDYGSKYEEPGYIASFILKNVTNLVKIKSNVNTKKLGSYEVDYYLKLGNYKIHQKRNVEIIDNESPVIELSGDGYICPGSKYKEEGYKAYDNYDGNLTDKVEKNVSKDKITYTVKDSSSNKTEITRNIVYEDIKKPNITLNGNDTITIAVGEEYNDEGVSVSDNCDSNLKVKKTGSVNTKKKGTYFITYFVTDSSGNKNNIRRKIKVVDEIKRGTGKFIYLTFDDGPSESITPNLLQILKEEKVKATFFVINHDDSLNYLIKQEDTDGHMVALHSFTHTYSYVYSSIDNYFKDLNDIKEKVHNITGKSSNIIRFPGGSSNTVSRRYQEGIMTYLTGEVVNQGYYYFDWNVDSDDAGSAHDENEVYTNVVNNLDYTNNIVLMHDFEGNDKTLNAIRNIIHYGKENGYTFKVIDENTQPIRHSVNN